jgi:hypothetical protein
LIATLIVAVEAHWLASGVKVKVKVPATAVLIAAGDHDPVIPSMEVPGRAAGVDPTK